MIKMRDTLVDRGQAKGLKMICNAIGVGRK
jgi:hypothetical protein